MVNGNRFGYHYEYILRQDLLLKLTNSNIMETPKLCKIIIVSQIAYESLNYLSLALEIICGQKTIQIEPRGTGLSQSLFSRTSKQHKYNPNRSRKGFKQPNYYVQACLRGNGMMNFIDKLVTTTCFYDYNVQIKNNIIQLTIGSNLVRLFPEIENHFEIFENVSSLQIMIITSAKNKEETRLIWTGLFQKEIENYVKSKT